MSVYLSKGKFGTAINCMDGRVQLVLCQWMKEKYGLDYVDTITEPGVDRILSEGSAAERAAIEKKARISVEVHGSKIIAIVGHHDCAGNPVCKEDHCGQVKEAVRVVKSWKLPAEVVGVWIGEDWSVTIAV